MPKPRRFHSLATKFSVFTALLVLWMTTAQISFRLTRHYFSLFEHVFLSLVLLFTAVLIARLTSRLFVRPLGILEVAIAAVGQGRREAICTSRTGDEIERLGESFNAMIVALASSERAVREHQKHLEARIRERTEALEEAMRCAQAASQAKGEFLANMSHELRTPMNGVLGMIDLVLESPLNEQQREELSTAKECSLSLLALINDILDLSKIEAGKMTLEKVSISPRELLDHCAKALRPRAREKGIGLFCETCGPLPRALIGDPLRLRQVLTNLLGNAVKFTDHGSVRIRLTARRAAGAGRFELHFEVTDTGIGIPAGKLAFIFEEFTQADGSVTRRYGGTGLGLSIAKRIVGMYGGKIWVESEVGRGSVFHVLLELEEAEAADATAAPEDAQSARTRPPAPPQREPVRILVVEDNLVNQKVVSGILGKRGFEARVAAHGGEALETLDRIAFDLVLMDLHMPVMDGLETTRRIRRDPRWASLPIIGLTAHTMSGDRERCLEAGMNDYLTKPLQPEVLLATMGKHLHAAGR